MYRGMVNASALVIATSGKLTFAIEVSSGMTQWAYAMGTAPCRVVVGHERVYIASSGELACVEYLTGKSIFHVKTPLGPDVTLLVDGDSNIYVGASGQVACYGQFGDRRWLNDLQTGQSVGFALPGLSQQADLF